MRIEQSNVSLACYEGILFRSVIISEADFNELFPLCLKNYFESIEMFQLRMCQNYMLGGHII